MPCVCRTSDALPVVPSAEEVDRRELKLLEREIEASRLQIDEQRLALVKAHTEVEMLKREVEQARLQRKVWSGVWHVDVCDNRCVCSCRKNPLTVISNACRRSERVFNAGRMKRRTRKQVGRLRRRCYELLQDLVSR